jgi:succinyl-diaminopimelate desuccinylase
MKSNPVDTVLRKNIIDLTSKLIRFKTCKDNPSELKKIADFINSFFSPKKFSVKQFAKNNKHSLVITPRGISNPKLLLLCHADVVEAADKDFIPKKKGDWLFARGSADMKSGLAIAMLLLKNNPDKKTGLIVTTDEEIGGMNGARVLASRFAPDFVVATESSDLNIVVKEKGLLWIRMIAKGKSCHSSMPWKGTNAADMLIDAYLEMRKSIPQVKKASWQNTMNLGRICAGNSPNIVPDEAEMVLDVRYTEKSSIAKILGIIKKAVKGKNIMVAVLGKEQMMLNKKNDKNIAELGRCIALAAGRKPLLTSEHGASDARFFSGKSSCVMFGPVGKNFHAEKECVNISSAVKTYSALQEYVKKNC